MVSMIPTSYGLDPRFTDQEWRVAMDAAIIDGLRAWAERNAGETILPTGIRARNLNPLIEHDRLTEAWWGHLDGKTARNPSINSRIERLSQCRTPLRTAIAPEWYWRGVQKPSKLWHHLDQDRQLLALAAITQPGATEDGQECAATPWSCSPSPRRSRMCMIGCRCSSPPAPLTNG